MTDLARLVAIEDIKQLKARYFRAVDTADNTLMRSIFAEDCVLDYRGCCTDPASGRDFLPAMNVVLRGAASVGADALRKAGITSVHHGYMPEIEIVDDAHARGVWAMTDRLYFPAGAPFACMIGHGHYHETYEKIAGAWKIKTLRITRLKMEAA